MRAALPTSSLGDCRQATELIWDAAAAVVCEYFGQQLWPSHPRFEGRLDFFTPMVPKIGSSVLAQTRLQIVYLVIHIVVAQQQGHMYGLSWICQPHSSGSAQCSYLDLLVWPSCICQTHSSAFVNRLTGIDTVYVPIHPLARLALRFYKVPGGKMTPHNIYFRVILTP